MEPKKGKRIVKKYIYSKIHDLYIKLKSYFYYGSNHYCIFCKNYFRKFLPLGVKKKVLINKQIIGGGYRPHVVCPSCGSTDRERLLYYFFSHKTDLLLSKKSIKLLHVAPEKNIQEVIRSNPKIKYYGADINLKLADIRMDITKIKFSDNFFDVIICCHVLEHILDDKKAITELYRVLKPNGWAILQVPFSPKLTRTFENPDIKSPTDREDIFGQKDHVRIYGKDYKNRLEKAGFKVSVDFFAKMLDKKTARLYAINNDEPIFYCRKNKFSVKI